MEQKSETEKRATDAQTKAQHEARRMLDETWKHAYQGYKEAKKQADIVYKEAKKIVVDKPAEKAADEAHKEAIEQAKKLRDAIVAEAMVVFRSSYDQAIADYAETTTKSLKASKGIPHRRALTLRAAKGLRPFGNPE